MSRRDFARRSLGDRLRARGTADVDDMGWGHRPLPPTKRQSKADQRAETERLMAEFEARKKPARIAAAPVSKPTVKSKRPISK